MVASVNYVAHGNVVGFLVTVVGNRAVLVTNTNPQAESGGRASVDDFTGGRGVNRSTNLVGNVDGLGRFACICGASW